MDPNTTPTTPLTSGETSTPGAGSTSGATSTPGAPPTHEAAKPAAEAKSEKKKNKSTEPEELQAASFKQGEEVALNFGVAGKVPAVISGVFSDKTGISYAAEIHVKDAVSVTGAKARTVEIEVPASVIEKPEAAKEQKAKK